jgi:hypothetical protein
MRRPVHFRATDSRLRNRGGVRWSHALDQAVPRARGDRCGCRFGRRTLFPELGRGLSFAGGNRQRAPHGHREALGMKNFERILSRLDENVPFPPRWKCSLLSEKSLPFPLSPIVPRAAEPVKASLRRAQGRRAALTEPAARGTHFSHQEGMGTFGSPLQGDVSTLLPRGTFLLCRDTMFLRLDKIYPLWI